MRGTVSGVWVRRGAGCDGEVRGGLLRGTRGTGEKLESLEGRSREGQTRRERDEGAGALSRHTKKRREAEQGGKKTGWEGSLPATTRRRTRTREEKADEVDSTCEGPALESGLVD